MAVEFRVSARYELCEAIGQGAYGVVVSARDTQTGERVAIKKVVLADARHAKRVLRELKVMRHCSHASVLPLLGLEMPSRASHAVYLVTPLMDTDLAQVLASQRLSARHVQYLAHQLLAALAHLHGCRVLHRDVKPANVLVNGDCSLRLADLGMARALPSVEHTQAPWQSSDEPTLTVYVATRWYRAPEARPSVILAREYSTAIDVWGAGCVIAECLRGEALFQGGHYLHQITRIVEVLGTPPRDDIEGLLHEPARQYVCSLGEHAGTPWTRLLPQCAPEGTVSQPAALTALAVDFVRSMLAFNPRKRAPVHALLSHPFLAAFPPPPLVATPVSAEDFAFEEREMALADYMELLWDECEQHGPTGDAMEVG